MRKERRSRKQIKFDLNHHYHKMETVVSKQAYASFKRKPYSSSGTCTSA